MSPDDARTELDPLSILEVIDRLIVSPVRLEPDRLSVTYTVEREGESQSTELAFKYGETVFIPGDRASENLASMIACQVAINYGLFCREIVFHGPLDTVDVRFITDMTENTAREIYVNKFLVPNPFLTGDAATLPVVRRRTYSRARLLFPDVVDRDSIPWQGPLSDRKKIAVLSSGGKDSLLSYGLLDELGYDVHPVYGNESGRHWFTALNAFRHFEKHVPNTARVWMSADRVFSWMLRHLPFVRTDFATVRADIYPIRLWTVAVFLFASLPIVRKRGIGRVVIGNEHDTTRRVQTHGITHYDGLYDQSRYFDHTLSRYYQRKEMWIAQFSILRTVSELVVQQTLAARYPELHRHQVSCHSAHKEGDRYRPCGKCEKCRRIVGMLTAGGFDPAVCGYTADQIAACLDAVARKDVHQAGADAEHLLWLLRKKGLITAATRKSRSKAAHGQAGAAREHPEVERLRFDPERSPVEGLPQDLRGPLFRLLLERVPGANERIGRQWVPVDPLHPERLGIPYTFERGMPTVETAGAGSRVDSTVLWGEMTWPVAQRRLKEVDVALLPVGAIEQHGHHLPLDTDTFDAEFLCRSVAAACPDPKPFVLPTIPYGVSYHHDDFAGTISVTNETLARFVYEVGMAAARNGIQKLVIVNGHGGNAPTLNFAAQMINRDARIFVCVDSGESSDAEVDALISTPNDVHAGEIETSTSLANRSYLVHMDLALREVPSFSSRYLDFTANESIPWYAFTNRISRSGVMGDATAASAEKGRLMWQIMIRHLVTFVEELKAMTLDQVYQKRY